ncbi:MAG: alkaline phosphatase [bacterium]
MQKDTIRRFGVGVIALGIVLCIAGFHYRHAITGAIQFLSLPGVQPPPAGSMRFAVIGDYGSGSPMERDVELMIRSWAPDFIGTVGDNDYADGTARTIDDRIGKYYHSYIAPYMGRHGSAASKNRFFPVPGHRDWDNDNLRPYLDYFTLPGNERYYDVVWGPVHLFMLDTDEREPDGATEDSIQGRWLEQRLKASTASWKLVFAHHAPYTSHRVPATSRMRWPFKAWGADAVLSGYYHVYERLQIDGIPYFVNGAGGTWVSNFGNTDNNSKFRYNEEFGAMIVEASATRITFRFVNRRGRVVDEHFIEKNKVGMNPVS